VVWGAWRTDGGGVEQYQHLALAASSRAVPLFQVDVVVTVTSTARRRCTGAWTTLTRTRAKRNHLCVWLNVEAFFNPSKPRLPLAHYPTSPPRCIHEVLMGKQLAWRLLSLPLYAWALPQAWRKNNHGHRKCARTYQRNGGRAGALFWRAPATRNDNGSENAQVSQQRACTMPRFLPRATLL